MVKTLTKQIAINVIQKQIKKIEKIKKQHSGSTDHTKWILETLEILEDIFGKDSRIYKNFGVIGYVPTGSFMASQFDYEEKLKIVQHEAFLSGLEKAEGVLESIISSIRRKGILVKSMGVSESKKPKTKNVFVVHGSDLHARDELVNILKKEFKLKPIILMDKPHQGKTIIEKFEKNSLNVGYAFIILTPDDEGYSLRKKEKPKSRARENVILELGYFIGKLGRENICCLKKEKTNIPSDLHGIGYVSFKESIKEAFLDIKNELESTGLIKQ